MKHVIVLALAVLSSSAFAETIYPQVSFSDASYFGTVLVGYDQVCVDGAKIKTLAPVTVCTEIGGTETGECLATESKVLSTATTLSYETPGDIESGASGVSYDIDYTKPALATVGYYGAEGDFVSTGSVLVSISACAK